MSRRLLFLCHRIPYPPDKGDKIRAWHILDHLAEDWEVDLGCLVDDPADLEHLQVLQARCASVTWAAVGGRGMAAARALLRLRPGMPLTLGWFHAPKLQDFVTAGLAAGRWDAVFVYSSALAPYVMGPDAAGIRRVLDLVDVDSEKWLAYAASGKPPMRQVWAREARTLLAFERKAAAIFDHTILVSEPEARRFAELAPESAARIGWVDNGVDMARFDGAAQYENPYRGSAPALVFTGTMSYRPNIEAAEWFARGVLPILRHHAAESGREMPEFHVVGANPAAAVRDLTSLPGVHVSGSVPDTRPYIVHAAAAVAPLRIARGIQNKVLEAMAMGRPVIASPQAYEGVRAMPGRDILVADGVTDMARAVGEVLAGQHPGLGAAGCAAVARGHDWSATLQRLDPLFGPPGQLTEAA